MTTETLHLFRDDDGNVYAARDLAHAKELWTKDTGKDPDEEGVEWQAIPDDAIIPEDDDGVITNKTAAQHAAEAKQAGCIGGNER